jgi:outer membrane protein OmpU
MGPISVGAQQTKVEAETANSDVERDAYGITFAVNENLSIGYGVSDTEYEATAKQKMKKTQVFKHLTLQVE